MGSFKRVPPPPKCPFCDQDLPDLMLGFMEHIEEKEGCRAAWNNWRENVKREAGGT